MKSSSASSAINLAPMVDFLFLVVAVFATMAITRAVLYDTEVSLVKVKQVNEGALSRALTSPIWSISASPAREHTNGSPK